MSYPVIMVNVSRESNQIQFPIGLSVVANALMKHNLGVRVLDMVPYAAEEREQIFKSSISSERSIYGFGVMIGNDHLQEVEKYVALIREKSPSSIIVYGGHFPSSMPELMLQHCSCDYVVHGEGERTFPALIQAVRDGNTSPENITGVFFRRDGKVIGARNQRIGKLNELSNPDFSLFNMEYYLNYLRETGQSWELMASRGCYGKCTFCYKFMGSGISLRQVSYVLDEIEYIIKHFDLRRFYFVDENFLQIKKYFREFIKEKNERGLEFTFIAQSRLDAIDEETCEIGSRNGLTCISSGIESVSQKTLDHINKKLTIKQAEDKIQLMRTYDIRPMVNFIIGFPWDTEDDYVELYDFITRNRLQKQVRLSYLTPLPSTQLFQGLVDQGVIKDVFGYAIKLDNLYWQRHINLTDMPDELLDHHFERITELSRRDLFDVKSAKYLRQIRSERFI
jgi:radical SAM superfamily enzyme YgiQ (UPF0313 family)